MLVVAVLVLTAGACTHDDKPAATASSSSGVASDANGPVVSGRYAIRGAFDLSGTYQVLYPIADENSGRCDRIASSTTKKSYVLPTPTIAGDVRLDWIASVHNFHGAGAYGIDDVRPISVDVRPTADAPARVFTDNPDAIVKLTVDANNGGTLEFARLKDSSGSELGGALTWTCA